MSFFYHMNGANIGTLSVKLVTKSGANSTVWSQSGDKGDRWSYGQLPVVSPKETYRVVIEGVRGNGYRGDIAIDDITFKQQNCGGKLKSICPKFQSFL